MTNEAAFYNNAAVKAAFAEYDRTGNMLELSRRLHIAGERMFGPSAGRKLASEIASREARQAYGTADRATRRAEEGCRA